MEKSFAGCFLLSSSSAPTDNEDDEEEVAGMPAVEVVDFAAGAGVGGVGGCDRSLGLFKGRGK